MPFVTTWIELKFILSEISQEINSYFIPMWNSKNPNKGEDKYIVNKYKIIHYEILPDTQQLLF